MVERLQEFEQKIDPILGILSLPEVTKHMEEIGKEDQTFFEYLAQNHDVRK